MTEELFHCGGRADTHPPMDLPRSAFDARTAQPRVCLMCQQAKQAVRRKQPHCTYCRRLLAAGQKTYCSEACREKGKQRRKRLYQRHEQPFTQPKPTAFPLNSRYLKAEAIVRRDVAPGFCRYCLAPVPYGQRRFCDAKHRELFGAMSQYVDSHRKRVTSRARGAKVRVIQRPDNDGVWMTLGRAVWEAMGSPERVDLHLRDNHTYMVPGNHYKVTNARAATGSLRLTIGVKHAMELNLRPVRYNVQQRGDIWYLYPAE